MGFSGPASDATAYLGGLRAHGLTDLTSDLSALDSTGRWAVVVTFEGAVTCARFDHWEPARLSSPAPWIGPSEAAWESSLDATEYQAAVGHIRAQIAAGEVYQANLCRVLRARLPGDDDAPDLVPLAAQLAATHEAPFNGYLQVPGLAVVTASPELFVRRAGRRISSSPIKGTGRTAADLTEKDAAENIMIVDLVRNDLSRVSEPGSVAVEDLLAVEAHPGLVHVVSTVTGRLTDTVTWPEIFAATFPPGSVSGAPKSSALRIIGELEPVARGPYCGAIGWVDADEQRAELAVGIRTFWARGGYLHFGTGAGITWGSDPEREWAETELKAERLVGLASC